MFVLSARAVEAERAPALSPAARNGGSAPIPVLSLRSGGFSVPGV